MKGCGLPCEVKMADHNWRADTIKEESTHQWIYEIYSLHVYTAEWHQRHKEEEGESTVCWMTLTLNLWQSTE